MQLTYAASQHTQNAARETKRRCASGPDTGVELQVLGPVHSSVQVLQPRSACSIFSS